MVGKPPSGTPTDIPKIKHLVCGTCNPINPPWKAFCGYEIKVINMDATEKCVVCLEMEANGCPNSH